LSSFLDNAPTYLVFFNTAQGMIDAGWDASAFGEIVDPVGIPFQILLAISCGSVFMGANTYIGNGPNFMVKAIAESAGYRTASFLRHMVSAVAVLAPVYVLAALWVSR
jgi:Na+/H+ antiporter NhaD/arsenite permease-like protein